MSSYQPNQLFCFNCAEFLTVNNLSVTECHHIFCFQCLEQDVESDRFICPYCRKITSLMETSCQKSNGILPHGSSLDLELLAFADFLATNFRIRSCQSQISMNVASDKIKSLTSMFESAVKEKREMEVEIGELKELLRRKDEEIEWKEAQLSGTNKSDASKKQRRKRRKKRSGFETEETTEMLRQRGEIGNFDPRFVRPNCSVSSYYERGGGRITGKVKVDNSMPENTFCFESNTSGPKEELRESQRFEHSCKKRAKYNNNGSGDSHFPGISQRDTSLDPSRR